MPDPADSRRGDARSEEVCDLVDHIAAGLALLRKTLSKPAAVTLALLLERDKIGDANAAVTSDAVRHDLASIQQLVQMGAAHAQTLGNLGRSEGGGVLSDNKIDTLTDAAAHREQHITQLGTGGVLGKLRERLKLSNGDVRSLNGLHHGNPS